MSAKAVLQDPEVAPSVALAALKRLLTPSALGWEFDTIRIELQRRGVEPTDGLLTKLAGALTIANGRQWCYDHDVLFAFAVACSGTPADSEALLHPTPEQLCWGLREITALTGAAITDEEGFDPDTIDPAIAAILHYSGYVLAPEPLAFAQEALDDHNRYAHDGDLRKDAKASWRVFNALPVGALRAALEKLDEDPLNVQMHRLGDCKLYVAAKELLRARQHAHLNE